MNISERQSFSSLAHQCHPTLRIKSYLFDGALNPLKEGPRFVLVFYINASWSFGQIKSVGTFHVCLSCMPLLHIWEVFTACVYQMPGDPLRCKVALPLSSYHTTDLFRIALDHQGRFYPWQWMCCLQAIFQSQSPAQLQSCHLLQPA